MKLTETWIEEILDRRFPGVELVALEEVGNPRHRVVRLYLDCPKGVTHDLCAEVSGVIGAALDEAGYSDAPYALEVSSPGLERPLTKRTHFEAQVGRKISVRTALPVAGQKMWRGVLREVRRDSIVLTDGAHEVEIGLGQIAKANLVFELK